MIFKDYYEILNVNHNASMDEIKYSFKKLAMKWHPDRNLGLDTTLMMQDLNEAYLILKDSHARQLYNTEYLKYIHRQNTEKCTDANAKNDKKKSSNYNESEIVDNELLKWIKNARKQAIELAKMSLADIKGMTTEATAAATKAMSIQIAGIILLIAIIALARSCQN